MDSIVARVKRLLEEDDFEITVVETLPPLNSVTCEESEPELRSDLADADLG